MRNERQHSAGSEGILPGVMQPGCDSSSDMRSGNTSNVHMAHSRPTREPVVLPQLALQAGLLRGDEVGAVPGLFRSKKFPKGVYGRGAYGKPDLRHLAGRNSSGYRSKRVSEAVDRDFNWMGLFKRICTLLLHKALLDFAVVYSYLCLIKVSSKKKKKKS